MEKYHKIQSIYKRDDRGRFLMGEYATPELAYLAELQWEWTEKVDGTNIRIGLELGVDGHLRYRVGGRTERAQIPVALLDAIAALGLEPKIRAAFSEGPGCLYGEGYGPRIQKGGKYRDDPSFVLFDVMVGDWWLKREDVENVATTLGIDVVPLLGHGTIPEAISQVKGGLISQWGDFEAEGIVARPMVPLCTRAGHRVITKVKGRDFRV